jgi:hypothetical protein
MMKNCKTEQQKQNELRVSPETAAQIGNVQQRINALKLALNDLVRDVNATIISLVAEQHALLNKIEKNEDVPEPGRSKQKT